MSRLGLRKRVQKKGEKEEEASSSSKHEEPSTVERKNEPEVEGEEKKEEKEGKKEDETMKKGRSVGTSHGVDAALTASGSEPFLGDTLAKGSGNRL